MPSEASEIQPLRDKRFVARVCGVSMGTVNRWVSQNRGPRHHKIGNLVRFRTEDIIEYLNSCAIGREEGPSARK